MVVLGDNVIIAHGATIVGAVSIGAPNGKPAFVGFNSYIDGATIEPDAMVTHFVTATMWSCTAVRMMRASRTQ